MGRNPIELRVRRPRPSRQFLPELAAALETRELPSGVGAAVAAPVPVPEPSRGASTPRAWNGPAAWRWVDGRWATRVASSFLGGLGALAGLRDLPAPAMQGVVRWSVGPSGVTAAAEAGSPGTVGGTMAVRFEADGVPRLDIHPGDDAPRATLRATAATRDSVTFQDVVAFGDEGGAAGQVLLRVTIRRNGAAGQRIAVDVGDPAGLAMLRLYEVGGRKLPARRG